MPVNLLSELLDPRGILLDAPFNDTTSCFGRIADTLVVEEIIPLSCRFRVIDGLLERERLHSTAVGGGVAIPHCFSDCIKETAFIFLRATAAIPMKAPDGRPVDLFFALFGPADDPSPHLRMVARLSRLARQSDLLQRLRTATAPGEVMKAVCEFDR